MSTKEKIKEEVVVREKEVNQHHIVLHNDEVNTFDFVINSLINVCEHTEEQAEQCTWFPWPGKDARGSYPDDYPSSYGEIHYRSHSIPERNERPARSVF